MSNPTEQHIVRHARTFAGLTLISRVLGLARDAILARLFGVTGLGTAWSIAFQFPNTFRRLFGEGALSAAFIPEYAGLLRNDRALAHRFSSLIIAVMSVALGAAVLIVEAILAAVLLSADLSDYGRRAIVLLAVMLPFMPLVCITAILGGMLQTHGRFAAQAGAPIIMNACMIGAAWLGSRLLGWSAESSAVLVAAAVTLAGALQVAWCLYDLRGLAVWSRVFDATRVPARRMFARMVPVMIGLGAIQIATLIESWLIVAWPIYRGPTMFGVPYPLDEAAGAALTNAQRLYQFPLGIFGIALATAAFPALARLAEEPARFAETLRRSIRLAAFIALPATAGLAWVAGDLSVVIYRGGAVTAEGAERIARCVVMYTLLVGAYSITHVLTRAFYARGRMRLPMYISIATVMFGLALGFGLIWVMREPGLALGSSIAALLQLALLGWFAHRSLGEGPAGLLDRTTLLPIARAAAGTVAMLGVLAAVRLLLPDADGSYRGHLVRLAVECAAGGGAYLALAGVLNRTEIGWLLSRGGTGPGSGGPPNVPTSAPN